MQPLYQYESPNYTYAFLLMAEFHNQWQIDEMIELHCYTSKDAGTGTAEVEIEPVGRLHHRIGDIVAVGASHWIGQPLVPGHPVSTAIYRAVHPIIGAGVDDIRVLRMEN